MAKETNMGGPGVPLSEDPEMDRLDEILRSQRPERREALMDMLNRQAASEGESDAREDAGS